MEKPLCERREDDVIEGVMVEGDVEAGDHPTVDQPLHSGTCGVGTEPDRTTQLALRQTRVDLQCTEDFSVDIVDHRVDHGSRPDLAELSVPRTVDYSS